MVHGDIYGLAIVYLARPEVRRVHRNQEDQWVPVNQEVLLRRKKTCKLRSTTRRARPRRNWLTRRPGVPRFALFVAIKEHH